MRYRCVTKTDIYLFIYLFILLVSFQRKAGEEARISFHSSKYLLTVEIYMVPTTHETVKYNIKDEDVETQSSISWPCQL